MCKPNTKITLCTDFKFVTEGKTQPFQQEVVCVLYASCMGPPGVNETTDHELWGKVGRSDLIKILRSLRREFYYVLVTQEGKKSISSSQCQRIVLLDDTPF